MTVSASAPGFSVRFQFHGTLSFFVRSPAVNRILCEKTSVKDAIESCGVPHTEVDVIQKDGAAIPFEHCLVADAVIDVYGVTDSPAKPGDGLQRRRVTKFVADGHLGKLARDLRFLGFDVIYEKSASDSWLAATCSHERALLTRDRRLLMHKVGQHGYCPRSHDPAEQIVEVIRRFDLIELIIPFSRCLHCNTPLTKVDKAQVFDQLEPLTKIYYHDFRRCPGCGKIYWSGSHFEKLEARLLQIRNALGVP
jgi:uncharacterized protein with PIN domain